MSATIDEYAKLPENRNIVRIVSKGLAMNDTNYTQVNLEKGGMKVRLEFPEQPHDTKAIKEEVRAILVCALQEQLKQTS